VSSVKRKKQPVSVERGGAPCATADDPIATRGLAPLHEKSRSDGLTISPHDTRESLKMGV
jgi:hypothetical protein